MKAYRAVVQLNFQSSLLFSDKAIINKIAQNKQFTNRQFDHQQHILFLVSPLTNVSAQISETQAIFQIDKNPHELQILEQSVSFFNNVLDNLSIEELTRIGLRISWGSEIDSKEEGIQLIKNNVLSSIPWQHFNNGPLGTNVIFHFIEDQVHFNFRLDSATAQYVSIDENGSQVSTSHFLEADLDVYCEGLIKSDSIKDFLEESYRQGMQKATFLLEAVKGASK